MNITLPPKSLRKESLDALEPQAGRSRLPAEQLRGIDAYWRAANYHKHDIATHGDDMPEVRDWEWPGGATAGRAPDTAADNV